MATPRREEWELVNGSISSVFEVQWLGPLRGTWPPRAGRRGVPPKGGTGKTLRPTKTVRKGGGGAGGWRTLAL